MGANNFIAFATIPAGAQVGPKASVDLWTLVPSTGLDPGFNVMCTGEFVGTIAVEASLDGVQFNPVGFFTLGNAQLVGPFEPTFELTPVVVDEIVRYLRLRVMPGTTVTGAIFATAGGAANCTCDTGGGGPDPYDLDPEPVDNNLVSPGISADYSRGDHVHGLTFMDLEGGPADVVASGAGNSNGVSLYPSRYDHVHELAADVITGYLSQVYALGLADNAVVDNTLVGTRHSIYFDGSDAGIFAFQDPASDGTDFDDHPLIRLKRHFTTFPSPGLVAEYETQYDSITNNNFIGGVRFDSFSVRDNGTRFPIVVHTHQAQRPIANAIGYDPAYASTEPYTTITWDLLNRRGGGNASIVSFNSDGGHFRNVILPDAGGPYAYYATLLDMVGTSGLPQIGSELIAWAVSVFNLTYDSPGQHEIGHAGAVYDAQNSGAGQYAGHLNWAVRSTLGGALIDAMQLYDDRLVIAAQTTATLSAVDTSSIGYILASDRLGLSNNGGAYSPIATLADLGPAAGTLAMVDVPSASTDFKTAATFTVVPTAARRFLPIAAYIEFTTITALATGPSVKLGNNVAHDNVAPAIVVANTAVTDNVLPFVMATIPQVIDLTATGIIAEMVANAAGTTCTGRIHVIGVYIT